MYNNRGLNLFLIALVISGCAGWPKHYGKLKSLPKQGEVTIGDLVNNWEDYHIYYTGLDAKSPLGVVFNPKNKDSILLGDMWKKVLHQKDLITITEWIYPYTYYEPWLSEILGPDGQFFGYLYHSYGPVVLKMVDDRKIYVYNLEEPWVEGHVGD